MTEIEYFSEVYSSLFLFIQKDEINIFLCGKNTKDVASIRAIINDKLCKHSRINIVFPEWLFPNLLEQSDADLITLENILASDVDKIILPLEGPGAYCELGSFVMNEKIAKKLIVVNKKEYEHKKSFITNGPLKLMKKANLGHVLYYDDVSTSDMLIELEKKVLFGRYDRSNRLIYNIFSFSTFLGILIGLFQPISKKILRQILNSWDKKIQISLIDPTIESLINNKYIVAQQKGKDEIFSLTQNGFNYYYSDLITHQNKQRVYSKLRSTAIWTKSKKGKNYSNEKERARLLELQQ